MKEQIEEMARILNRANGLDDTPAWYNDFLPDAEALYNAGYRKQKEGEWVDKSADRDEFYTWTYRCSICGHRAIIEDEGDSHFCPNCGAKMKGGE